MRDIAKLVAQLYPVARAASARAYSPYSGARVGACVLDAGGRVYSGCNVENASYGMTQCAERNALSTAISSGMPAGSARCLLIVATGFDALAPCGACRQVMLELMAPDALVIACRSEAEYRCWPVRELLPDPFALDPADEPRSAC